MRETEYREQRSTLLVNPFYALTPEKGGERGRVREGGGRRKIERNFKFEISHI